jgi:hypothetical protein
VIAARKPRVWPAGGQAAELHELVREIAAEIVDQGVRGLIDENRAFFTRLFRQAAPERIAEVRALYRQGGAVLGVTQDGLAGWLLHVVEVQEVSSDFE